MKVSLVVCHARNRVIAANGAMPWHLPADLKRFKEITFGHPIVMGRKTHETLGRALPGRRNIVLSRNTKTDVPDCETIASVGLLEVLVGDDECFVIGGGEIYRLFLPRAQKIYRTLVEAEPDGDVYFPEIDESEWETVAEDFRKADERNSYDLRFALLQRT